MYRILVWILIICLNQPVYNFNLVEKQSEQSRTLLRMADCITQVTLLLNHRKIAFEFSPDHQDLASEVIKKIGSPVILNAMEMRKFKGIEMRMSNDVMVVLNETEAERILTKTLWNGETRFLIAVKEENEARKYFEQFWKLKAINVFAIHQNEKEILLYSFLPYDKENCSRVEIQTVDTCREGKLSEKGLALKDPLRIKNINGCPISVTLTDAKPNLIFVEEGGRINSSQVEGFEGNLIHQLAEIYNFTPKFKTAKDGVGWGWIRPAPHGTVGDVYLGISDIGIGMLGPLLDRFENLDLSTNYNMEECVTFAVPKGSGAKTSAWLNIFILEFSLFTWILITFSFVMIIINVWLINRYSNVNWFASKTELVMSFFSSCLGAPIKIPDKASAKTSVASWIIFSFIVTVAYKASMGSKLIVPPRDADIYTFNELVKSDLVLTGYKNMIQLMKTEDWIFRTMRKKYQFTNYSTEYAVNRIANHEKLAYARHKTSFYYYTILNKKVRGKIHLLRDCLYYYYPVVATKKFSPFTNKINQLITRLEEFGIVEMWRSKYMIKIPPKQEPFTKLSLKQMSGLYVFLFIGYCVAFLILLAETFHHFLKYKTKPPFVAKRFLSFEKTEP